MYCAISQDSPPVFRFSCHFDQNTICSRNLTQVKISPTEINLMNIAQIPAATEVSVAQSVSAFGTVCYVLIIIFYVVNVRIPSMHPVSVICTCN